MSGGNVNQSPTEEIIDNLLSKLSKKKEFDEDLISKLRDLAVNNQLSNYQKLEEVIITQSGAMK